MQYTSLLPPEKSVKVYNFIKEKLQHYLSGENYTHVLFASSVKDIEILLRGGTKLSLISRKSPFSDVRSSLREISISGQTSDDQAHNILKALLSEPFQDQSISSTLHIHLATYKLSVNEADSSAEEGQISDLGLFEIIQPQATLEDLILPKEVKNRILRNLKVIKYSHILLDEWGLKDIPGFKNKAALSLNFVGTSGTGKTFAAEAIAHELNKPLMTVDYSTLESKYVGDTSKHIKTVFAAASKHEAVLFFDEADSFLGRRVEDVRQSYDAAVNNTRSVMLMELAKFDGVIIFATNLVSNYDPAFRRRILDHIEFPLPDENARAIILEKHTPAKLPGREQIDFRQLASKSNGLSAAELANVVYKSCIGMLEKVERGDSDFNISTEDCLNAIEEVKHSRKLIKDSIRLIEVNPDEVIEQAVKDKNNSTDEEQHSTNGHS